MKRTLLFGALFAALLAGAALASPQVILRVPVEVDNLPAALTTGQIECSLATTPTFDPTHIMARGRGQFAIEGGRYSGRVGVAMIPEGYPPGADGTIDARSYHCAITFRFACTSSSGVAGLCTSGPGGGPSGGAPAAAAALFAADPTRPPHGIIEGVIDRSGATTLPVRR